MTLCPYDPNEKGSYPDDDVSQPGSPWTMEGAMEDLNPPPPTWANTSTKSPVLNSAPILESPELAPLAVPPSSTVVGLPRCSLKRSRAIKVPLRLDTRRLHPRRAGMTIVEDAPRRSYSLSMSDNVDPYPWYTPTSPRCHTHDGRMPFSSLALDPAPPSSVPDTNEDVAWLRDRLERAPSVMGEHGHDVVFGFTTVTDTRNKSHKDLLVALGVVDPASDHQSMEEHGIESVPSPLTPQPSSWAEYSPNSLLRMADHVQHAVRSPSPSPLSVLCKGCMDMHAHAAPPVQWRSTSTQATVGQIEALMQELYTEWRGLLS